MTVDVIYYNHYDFTNSNGQQVTGTTVWWLEPAEVSATSCGTRPMKKSVPISFRKEFQGAGLYEFETNLAGNITAVKYLG